MSDKKQIVLIHPGAERALPELAESLRRAGAEVSEFFLTEDHTKLLDALQGDALPVVVKA